MPTVNWNIPVDHRDYDRMSGSIWMRCLQLLPHLEDHGVACLVNEPNEVADADVFVRWQDAEAQVLARQAKARDRKVVFDLCVNYFDKTEVPHVGKPVTEEHVRKCHRMVEVADVVTCGSPFISQRARDHGVRAVHMPESVDRSHFNNSKSEDDLRSDPLRAVWNGWSHKASALEPILPLLEERDIELVVISDEPPDLDTSGWDIPFVGGNLFEFRRWAYESFPDDLMRGDVILGPRDLGNPYNMGHSITKVGVGLAQGLPALASPVPSYAEVLDQGAGQLCRDLEEWEVALDDVVGNRDRLVRWSREARKLMEPYHTSNIAPRYVRLFEDLTRN